MTMTLMPSEVQCLRCGHKWIPKTTDRPKVCANCVCKKWDAPLVEDKLPGDSRPVVGFPNYFVSPCGFVYSMRFGRCKKLSSGKGGPRREYHFVILRRDNQSFNRTIHTLVALAFRGAKPTPLHEARHFNGNPDDNSASNIVWGTKSENSADRTRHGRNCGPRKIDADVVRRIRDLAEGGKKYVAIARSLSVSRGCVEKVVHGQTWACVK